MADEILYEVRDRIAIVTINRPHRRNALSWSALALFRETMRRATEDDQVLAVVITGAGGAFCAGTDLVDLTQTKSDQRGGSDTGNNWMVQSCPKPVVAAIDGPAVGLGAEIATQADVRIASDRMRIAWNFVKRGLVPDTGAASYLLPRQIGLMAALRYVLSGDFMSADEALKIGFVVAVVAPEDLLDRALAQARSLSQGSPMATRLVKELMYAGLDRTAEEHRLATRAALATCFASEDHREGVAAFLERRDPNFTGH